MNKTDSSRILVIEKAIKIIEALREEKKSIGVNELSRKLSLNGATTYRILRTLMYYGWIHQNSDGKYSIGYKLSMNFDSEQFYSILKDVSYFVMKRLTEQENESVNLIVRQNENGIILQQTRTNKLIDYVKPSGSFLPLHATACGKVLLSELPEQQVKNLISIMDFRPYTTNTITDKALFIEELKKVKARGYAVDLGESLENSNCISVPVRGPSEEIIAALSFTGILGEFTIEKENHYFDVLSKAAQEIKMEMFKTDDTH